MEENAVLKIHIGTSGYYYQHWMGIFYPVDLKKDKLFEFYAKNFKTVEMNSTFYHIPKEATVKNWYRKSPKDFIYSVKVFKGITHYKRLKNVKADVESFVELFGTLREKLGVFLFQLPPSLKFNKDRLKGFLKDLPPNFKYAVEFRHKSWYNSETYELLKEFNVSFCIHDFDQKPTPRICTANAVYMRFHGTNGHYAGSYSDEKLNEYAKLIDNFLGERKEVFCYFNNDFNGDAVRDAKRLIDIIKTVRR